MVVNPGIVGSSVVLSVVSLIVLSPDPPADASVEDSVEISVGCCVDSSVGCAVEVDVGFELLELEHVHTGLPLFSSTSTIELFFRFIRLPLIVQHSFSSDGA